MKRPSMKNQNNLDFITYSKRDIIRKQQDMILQIEFIKHKMTIIINRNILCSRFGITFSIES